jgi:Flp pilus assembly protein TadG
MADYSDLMLLRKDHPIRGLLSRALSDSRGVAAIEFAIIIPMLIMMVVCTADLGMGIYRTMQVQNAAQAGARYAMTNSFDATSISSAVTNATSFPGVVASPAPAQYCGCATNAGITAIACGATCAVGAVYGTYVKVSAQGTYATIVPYPLIASSFTLAAQASVRVQ